MTMTTTQSQFVLLHIRGLVATEATGRLTDAQLLERFTAGRSEAAFTELVRRHGPLVLGVCRRVLRHEQDAEDAFQATFLVLARKGGTVARRAIAQIDTDELFLWWRDTGERQD